jgi:hypothetical protein
MSTCLYPSLRPGRAGPPREPRPGTSVHQGGVTLARVYGSVLAASCRPRVRGGARASQHRYMSILNRIVQDAWSACMMSKDHVKVLATAPQTIVYAVSMQCLCCAGLFFIQDVPGQDLEQPAWGYW